MKEAIKDRVAGAGKIPSIAGAVFGAALSGAAGYFQATHNVTDWKPYAVAAAGAVAGLVYKGNKKP